MIPLFDGIDLASDAEFLLWFAGGMVAIGLVIGVYMVARRVGRWVGRRRKRLSYEYVDKVMTRIKTEAIYVSPVYWQDRSSTKDGVRRQ